MKDDQEIDEEMEVMEAELLRELETEPFCWQPSIDDGLNHDLFSFQVYKSLERGKEDWPEVKSWQPYDEGDIEEPEFMD